MARPFIHLNLALGADGAFANGGGSPLSSDTDWRRVHQLRERYDAIAVGARTWEVDLPRLTVRRERLGREPRRQPHRVIFGGSRPCAVAPDGRPTFLIAAISTPAAHQVEGAVLIRAGGHRLRAPLATLRGHGVRSLLVEGGPLLLRSFLAQRLYDRLTVFVRTDCPREAEGAVRGVLPVPPPLAVRRFGEGTLLAWRLRP